MALPKLTKLELQIMETLWSKGGDGECRRHGRRRDPRSSAPPHQVTCVRYPAPTDIMKPADVGVVQGRDGAGFAVEAIGELQTSGCAVTEDLAPFLTHRDDFFIQDQM